MKSIALFFSFALVVLAACDGHDEPPAAVTPPRNLLQPRIVKVEVADPPACHGRSITVQAVIRVPGIIESGQKPGINDVFITVAALLLCSPVLKPQHAIWLLPLLAVRID